MAGQYQNFYERKLKCLLSIPAIVVTMVGSFLLYAWWVQAVVSEWRY